MRRTDWQRRALIAVGVALGVAAAPASGAPAPGTVDLAATRDLGGRDGAMAVTVQPDGKLVVAASSRDPVTSRWKLVVLRHRANGTPDPGFSGDGAVAIPFDSDLGPVAVRLRPTDGKVLVAAVDGWDLRTIRLTPAGAVDRDVRTGLPFGNGIDGVVLQPDGRVLVAGERQETAGWVTSALVRVLPDGGLDPSFTPVESGNDWFYALFRALSVQSDGRIVFDDSQAGLRRVLPDGTPDASFGTAGIAPRIVDRTQAIAVQSDGRILSTGATADGRSVRIARARPDGSPDPSFGSGGVATVALGEDVSAGPLLIQPNGRIVVAAAAFGITPTAYVLRFSAAGVLERTFGSNGIQRLAVPGTTGLYPGDPAIQGDGRLVLAGTAVVGPTDDDRDVALVRLWGDPVPACNGKAPTIAGGGGLLYGSPAADVIVGGVGPDRVFGGAGDDTICSAAGDDRVYGEPGDDVIRLGLGSDRAEGGYGADRIFGEAGDDWLFGLADADRLDGGDGFDRADGGSGVDTGVNNEVQAAIP